MASKWRGDSEKLVRILFELAYYNAPSIIFIDEIEAILSERGSQGEHEASKRAKAEFLIHLDGIRSNKYQSNEPVLFLASTNLPWTLDPAIIRRYLLKNTNKTKVQLSMTFESFYDLYLLSFCLVQAIKYDEISNIRKNTLAFLIL